MKQRNFYLSDETIRKIEAIVKLRTMKYNAVITVAVDNLYNSLFHGPSDVTMGEAEKATAGEKNV